MDRSSKHTVNKETVVLNDTLEQMDLIDIFRVFLSKEVKYTIFSSAHKTFSRPTTCETIKKSLNKFKYYLCPQWYKTINHLKEERLNTEERN